MHLLVTYNVVGYPDRETDAFGVLVDGKVTKLTTTSTTFPLWSGKVVGASAGSEYKYVKLDGSNNNEVLSQEGFSRKLEDPVAIATRNDFYERPFTKLDLPEVPLVYDPWPMSNSKVFDENQIATFHLTVDEGQWEKILKKSEGSNPIKANIRFINAKMVHNVENVSFGVSGKSSMEFKKQAFKFEFKKELNQTFFGRPSIKLRSETSDPTMMREKLYIDVLNAMGVPTQQGVWVRLYVNSKPVGLYLMVDDISKSFLKQTVHDDKEVNRGALWQMNAPVVDQQADLTFMGPSQDAYPEDVYKMKNLGANPETAPMTQLIQFMKDLEQFSIDPSDPFEYWNSRLDLEGFLRNMAMEYLGGSWDAYWYSGSNYFMYFNPTQGKSGRWQWISTDFDGTFGDGDPTDTLTTYQDYADFSKHDRPMITKLILKNKAINSRFEEVLKETVGYAFKPDALFPRIDAYERMLALEVAWDYGLEGARSKYPGKTNAWTIQDFHNSIKGSVKNMELGIKPWIQGRKDGLEKQLQFKVQPGTPDRVKRPIRRPRGGKSDVEVNSKKAFDSHATLTFMPHLSGWALMAMTAIAFF
ncbi:hypothetical protein BGZ94_000734 [Podila epigama]|nr:hypothetical protein BGZ94_000734 [Podila epigama]